MASPESPEHRSSLLRQPSKVWGVNHLRALRVTQQLNVPAVELVGATYLPADQDGVFRRLAVQIAQPTEKDLENPDFVNRSRGHPFLPMFVEIYYGSGLESIPEESSFRILNNFVETLKYYVTMTSTVIKWGYEGNMKFPIQRGHIKCLIDCKGIIQPVGMAEILPIATFVAWDLDHNIDTAAQQTLQFLAQGIAAYDDDPGQDYYRAFVLCMQGTCLQLATTTPSRTYMEELCEDKPLSQDLQLRRSELFDLRKPVQRVEALRLVIGLLRFLEENLGLPVEE